MINFKFSRLQIPGFIGQLAYFPGFKAIFANFQDFPGGEVQFQAFPGFLQVSPGGGHPVLTKLLH